jgi:hypothetical protein
MPILQDSLQNAQAGVPNPMMAAASSPQNLDQAAPAPGGDLPPPNPATTSPLVKAHEDELATMIKIMPPKMADAYQRVLTAGKKMMYAKETAEAIHGLILDDQVPMKNKLGEGVANLLVMMDNQGNGTIPKDVLIPVGVSLLFEAADYMFECGIEVTEQDLSDGMEIMVYAVYKAYNIPEEQVDKVIDDLMGKLDLSDEQKQKFADTKKAEGEADMEAAEAETAAQEAAEGAAGEEAEFAAGFAAEQQKRGV